MKRVFVGLVALVALGLFEWSSWPTHSLFAEQRIPGKRVPVERAPA